MKKPSHLDNRLLELIKSLDKSKGCFATNNYLAKQLNSNSTSISRSLNKLLDFGLINITKVGLKRTIQINSSYKNAMTGVYQSGNHIIKNKQKVKKDDIKTKEINDTKISENEIVTSIIENDDFDKIKIYSELKRTFLAKCPLRWDRYTMKSFAQLCNYLISSFNTRIADYPKSEKVEILNKILLIILESDLPFLKNVLPIGIVSKWNQIMSDKKFLKSLNNVLTDRYDRTESRFV